MIRLSFDSLETGMKVAKPVYDANGNLLLGRGVLLNPFLLKKLDNRGIDTLYIQDDATDDIEPHDNISDMVRGATIKHLKGLFGSIEDMSKEVKDQSLKAVTDAITSNQFKSTFKNNPAFTKVIDDMSSIVDQLISGEVTLGLNSIKTYDNYTFQHSIDVAIVAIMIGRKIGLDKKRLRELGVGCVLHDIGKTFVPVEIVNSPNKLTDEEYEIMKNHPRIGYELVKDVPSIGLLPPHVALQHHEKQDGTGYPRQLTGSNKLAISSEPRTIHIYGSVAAVADIYDALSSDRPYRKAWQPEKVIKIMRDMKSTHLNHDVLNAFLLVTPVYPVGTTIRIIDGDYKFHFGVITEVNNEKLERPHVRLILNGQKKKIDPININLLERENIIIESFLL